MGKILVFASVAISLATAGIGFVNKGKLGDARNEATTAQANADTANKKAAEAATQLTAAKNDLQTAKSEKDQAVAEATQAKSQLEQTKTSLADVTTKSTALQSEVDGLKVDLDNAKKELADKVASGGGTIAPTGPDADTLAKLQEQETLISKLTSELEAARQSKKVIEDKEIARQNQQLKKGTEGRVLAVNPAWNFVVLNLGDKQGVSNNTELLVKRGTRYLGKVRITSVEPSTSIADIVANSMPQGTTITPGDNVIFQGTDEQE